MNYNKILADTIYFFNNSSPRERLLKRNPKDDRLSNESILYTELHHIIPKSLGGSNDNGNLVAVLPEEHLFLHQLRYIVFDKREDMLAVRFMINGCNSKKNIKLSRTLSKSIRQNYAWMRQKKFSFRKKHGWHTEDGKKQISNARKNTMVVKDLDGNLIGMRKLDHENILNGLWVNHTTKSMTVIDKNTLLKIRIDSSIYDAEIHSVLRKQDGQNNGNYNSLSKQDILEFINDFKNIIFEENHYIQKNFLREFNKISMDQKKRKISYQIIKKRFQSSGNLILEYNKMYNDTKEYNRFFRSKKQKEAISNKLKKRKK